MSEDVGKWVTIGEDKFNKRCKPIYLDAEPTPELVKKLIDNHKMYEVGRYELLQNYYEGYSNILERVKEDPDKPNNKLVSAFPSYIVDLMQGMTVGKPVKYTSSNKDFVEDIQDIFNYNDEQDENSELAKMAGIKGKAYEIVYIDEESKIRFNEVNADNLIMVFDTKLNPDVNFAIMYSYATDINNVADGNGLLKATVYTKDKIIHYNNSESGLVVEKEEQHHFKQVPVIEFLNNDEAIGDFERVISLIDAYDKTQSDTANDFEEFTDAFLVLVKMEGTDSENVKDLRKNKIILTDGDGQSAYWLVKNINDTALANYKDRLNNDIHKFAKVPDMSDEQFAGSASGESMKFKLMAMDQVIAAKQRKFKRALQKRIELICTYYEYKGKNYDYRDIDIMFDSNRPINEKEAVEKAIQMLGITSLSTALSKVPGVDDVEAELAKIGEEKGLYTDSIDLDKVVDEDEIIR